MAEEADANTNESLIKKKYQDLCLDLNLDKATADDAWNNYETIQQSYTLEGDQLPWLACALYTSCRKRSVPTVGGRPGNVIQGNCVSLTRMLQHCNLPLTDFIMKMKAWLAMSHCDEDFCRRVDLLERNFAVSSNIFKEYKPIFLDLFQDPNNDQPRAPRSRKQRRPPCNATELFNFCWTLYIFIKGKYPSIPQDLVSCYSLLLACIDLIYANVILSNRKDLLNPTCQGLPDDLLESDEKVDLSSWPVSIMDYLCKKFEGVVVDTKVVRDYYWKTNIEDLVKRGLLKGTSEGTGLIDQMNFDHNVKEIKNAYEEYLLSCGEFDERMFLNDTLVIKGSTKVATAPSQYNLNQTQQTSNFNINSSSIRSSARCNLSQTFESDHHLVPQTPITCRKYTFNRPKGGNTPLTVITTGLQKLYTLIAGRKNMPGEKLMEIFRSLKNNPEERISSLIKEMSENFTNLYSKATEDYTSPSFEFTKMRLQMGQILYYTFLEHILLDEKKREIDLQAILKEELFHKTLFTCCLEIVLKSYNDARRFPWSLQVGGVDPYYFMRIVEPVIRSEKQSENQLSRELVKHLKVIEEQILDSLAWRSESPLWQIVKDTGEGIPSCEDVNFSHQLETGVDIMNQTTYLHSSSIMSPAVKVPKDFPQSPLSSIGDRMDSPNSQVSARRMLFPSATSTGPSNKTTDALKRMQPPTLTLTGAPKTVISPNSNTRVPVENGSEDASVKECVENFLQTTSQPTPSAPSDNPSSKLDPKKDKPKRHGSLALFFRKFYTLANMRLRDLCDRLDILNPELRQKIWTCFEYSIIHYTEIMKDRHMDQMVMCAIYITCKVTGADRIFQEIMKHYRNQPQAASHVYRSVLISKTGSKPDSNADTSVKEVGSPSIYQSKGSSTSTASGERGDLIKFYNKVYVQNLRTFALKFRPAQEEAPKLSPLPVTRITPVSPRRRISFNHSVYVNSLNANSPLKGTTPMSPKRPLPYYFNRSPAKDLRVINNMVKMQGSSKRKLLTETDGESKPSRIEEFNSIGGVSQRFQGVFVKHQSPTSFDNPIQGGGVNPDHPNGSESGSELIRVPSPPTFKCSES